MKKLVSIFGAITALAVGTLSCTAIKKCFRDAGNTNNDHASAVCTHCGDASCSIDCVSNPDATTNQDGEDDEKPILSCSLNAHEQDARMDTLRGPIFSKVVEIRELKTGYNLVFNEPIDFSKELLDVVNFERNCCSSYTWALVFDPFNKATHLQVYGSKSVKKEMKAGFENYGLGSLIR